MAARNTEDTNPVWTADGETVLYYSYRHGNAQLYALSPKTGEERRLTQTETFEMFPAPAGSDGSQLVFVSDRDGERRFQQMEIYLMDSAGDGSDAVRLTSDDGTCDGSIQVKVADQELAPCPIEMGGAA